MKTLTIEEIESRLDDDGNVDFSHCDLRAFDFRGHNLMYANFELADLRGCNFQNVDLRNANFEFADLRGAKLLGANFKHALIKKAVLGRGAIITDCEYHLTKWKYYMQRLDLSTFVTAKEPVTTIEEVIKEMRGEIEELNKRTLFLELAIKEIKKHTK